MLKNMLKLNYIWFLGLCLFVVSCTDSKEMDDLNDNTEEVTNNLTDAELDEYTYEAIDRMQETGNLGRHGCAEIVFPISVQLGDNVREINDYRELFRLIRAWRENHPDAPIHPTIVLPINVINQDGEIISLETPEQLRRLRLACDRPHVRPGDRPGGHHHGRACFTLNYPLTLVFPDGTFEDAVDRQELRQILRTWRQDNPDSDERPMVSFPLEVTMDDGEVVVLNSYEELRALKEECRG